MTKYSLSGLERLLLEGGVKADSDDSIVHRPEICGDIDIRIARDGTWYYFGSPIGRKPLVKLFASVLQRDASGDFWLITPAEMCRISVDDAPFIAVEMSIDSEEREQVLRFRTNIGEVLTAGPDHAIRVAIDRETGEPTPYIMVREGLEALIVRSVFYEMVEFGEERYIDGKATLTIRSNGVVFEIGPLDDA